MSGTRPAGGVRAAGCDFRPYVEVQGASGGSRVSVVSARAAYVLFARKSLAYCEL